MHGNKVDQIERAIETIDKKVSAEKFVKLLFDFGCMQSEVKLFQQMFNEKTFHAIEESSRQIIDMKIGFDAVLEKSNRMITIDTIEKLQKEMKQLTPLHRVEEMDKDIAQMVSKSDL